MKNYDGVIIKPEAAVVNKIEEISLEQAMGIHSCGDQIALVEALDEKEPAI
jgi:hypothetical protein